MNKNKTRHNSLAEFFNTIRVTHIHFLDDIERDSLSLKFDLHSFAEFGSFASTLAPLVPHCFHEAPKLSYTVDISTF